LPTLHDPHQIHRNHGDPGGAFSGFIEARRKRMDLVGVFTVAFITAFGGGTLRDILLDRRPLFWVSTRNTRS
jgi:uncharacterized membrane protein YeiH